MKSKNGHIRREHALERRKQQLGQYKLGNFVNKKGEPLWRWGQPSEHRIVELAEQEIASLEKRLSRR